MRSTVPRLLAALAVRPGGRDTGRAMSEENVEIVRLVMEAAERRDFSTMFELISDDLVFNSTFAASEGRVFRGHQGIRDYFESAEDSFDDFKVEVDDIRDAPGERVVLLCWVRGKGKGSGVPVEHLFGQVWTVSGGKTVRIDSYPETEAALEAAGLSE